MRGQLCSGSKEWAKWRGERTREVTRRDRIEQDQDPPRSILALSHVRVISFHPADEISPHLGSAYFAPAGRGTPSEIPQTEEPEYLSTAHSICPRNDLINSPTEMQPRERGYREKLRTKKRVQCRCISRHSLAAIHAYQTNECNCVLLASASIWIFSSKLVKLKAESRFADNNFVMEN